MDDGIAAARRHFPAKAEAISERASRDTVFGEICRDFAEAKTELAKWEASMDPQGANRCTEYRELIAALANEIETALDSAEVILLHRPPSKGSR